LVWPLKFSSSLRDSVYGAVPITSCEAEILKLPIMSRLKQVKQLGLAYLSYTGGNHTRFEHSIGTMHVASLMSQGIGLDEHEIEMIRVSALLHDVGHPPFSHCVEFAFNMFGRQPTLTHEFVTRDKIKKDEQLARVMKNSYPTFHLEDIANLAAGTYDVPHFNSIVNGPIDADKIDYILRDNYHCGFPVALDINTITEILCKDPQGRSGILIKPEGRSFAEQLFIARYHLITKIHHDKVNRLATYLMALALKEAWEKDKASEESIHKMFYEWNEYELLNYLAANASQYYVLLDDFISGKEDIQEVANFGYHELAPYGRYNAALLSSNLSLLPSLSAELSKQMNNKRVFLDAFRVRPPDLSLSVASDPSTYLIDTPLIRGSVQSSLSEIHLGVYSLDNITEADFNYDQIIEEYKKNLDDKMDRTKADNIVKQWYKGNRTMVCLRYLVECLANRSTIELRQKCVPTSDFILLMLQAIYETFVKHFKLRVYVDSLSNLADIYLSARKEGIFKNSAGQEIAGYTIERTEEKGWPKMVFDPKLLIDLESLETYGLIYRLSHVSKVGDRYTLKYQLRVSGWGQGYHQRNLSYAKEELALFARLKSHFDELMKQNENMYKRYFELVTREQFDTQAERESKEIRKKLPIKVVL